MWRYKQGHDNSKEAFDTWRKVIQKERTLFYTYETNN